MSFNTFIGIGLTLHVADKSALAAINRALRGCHIRSQDPWYFGNYSASWEKSPKEVARGRHIC